MDRQCIVEIVEIWCPDIHALHLRTSSANYPSLLKLLDLVLDHSSQLRETTWTLSYTHLQHIIESGASFPQLESLTLQLGGGSFPDNVNQLFGALPRLVQYTMDFIDPLSHLPSLDLPWAQLQKCELRHCPLLQVAGILPLLGPEANVVLYRCGSGRTAGGSWNQGAIVSHIQSLVLTSCDERHARWLLEFLVAPRLKKLSIQIGTDAAKTLPLQRFLTRSRCQLTHVAFSVQMNPGRRTNSDEIAAVLSGLLSSDAVSSVTHLDCRTSNRRLFLQLLTEDGGSALLPCLKTLTLRGEDFAGFVPALREYLVSRGPAAPTVWIDRLGVPSTTLSIEVIMFERKLQGWRDSGMEFDVRMPVEAIPVPHLSPLWAT
ncbi:hypothetical protein HMN09_01330200 [Mycena chlorophos]|uniref:Uncharacterized protein n=1 Tax=Mycena chlorophos TaxID=658473 RepID=A0A8H6S0A6_MYCCL|nr:hypothetical protein HMN09_01330200 [Mycena chlorophos]